MSNDKADNTEEQFDIRDEAMEIDDALEAGLPADPLETTPELGSDNWQSELVSRAKEKGLPQEMLEKLEGANAVDDILSIIVGAVQKESAPVDPEPSYPTEGQSSEFVLDIDEATAFDPDAAKALKAMNAHYASKIRELESRLAVQKGVEAASAAKSFVKDLGAEWRGVFGTDEKPNVQAIRKLDDAVQTIRAGYVARHKRVPDEKTLLGMALNAEFGNRQEEVARAKFTDKVAKRASQIVSRPGTRTAPSANPRMRAAQGVADWFRSKGIDPYGNDGDEFA